MLKPSSTPSKRRTGVLPMMFVLYVGRAEPEAVASLALPLRSVHVPSGSPSLRLKSIVRYHIWMPVKSEGRTDGPDEPVGGAFQNPSGIGTVARAEAETNSPAAVRTNLRRLWREC